MTHKATPEQWAAAEEYGIADLSSYAYSCILELRDRIAALEAQRETEKACIQDIYEKLDRLKVQHESNWARIVKMEAANRQGLLDSSPAPAGGLVERAAATQATPPAAIDLLQRLAVALPSDHALYDEAWDYLRQFPPCQECGAMTAKEAEGRCNCAGDKDYCHGCELWPDDAPPTSPAPADGLVERVAGIIVNGQACDYDEERTACAAILAVAEWLGEEISAEWLREEVER